MEPEIKKRTFKQLSDNFLKFELGLSRVTESKFLLNWINLAEKQEVNSDEELMLKRFQRTLITRSATWNEYELTEWFIGPVMAMIEFNTDAISLFAQHEISAQVKHCFLSGRPDALIAKGINEPIVPYFCFSEYKRQTDPDGNPLTQLLGAMITAQALNNNERPIYGIYVIGKTWWFVTLDDNHWCESKSFSADDEELFTIFCMLKALKEIILGF